MGYGTEDLDIVMEMHESMSEHLTYRQERFNKNRSQADIISFEREPDIDELENYIDGRYYGSKYDLDFCAEDNVGDVYDDDIIKLEYRENK